jgi:hypothetical protein
LLAAPHDQTVHGEEMASEEHKIRERLWARAQVWREQHSPEKASAGY